MPNLRQRLGRRRPQGGRPMSKIAGLIAVMVAVLTATGCGGPNTFTMPDYLGKNCQESHDDFSQRFESVGHGDGWFADDDHDSGGVTCHGGIVYRTEPAAGETVTVKSYAKVEWWFIRPEVRRWYHQHRTMPDLIGKTFRDHPVEDLPFLSWYRPLDHDLVEVVSHKRATYPPGAYPTDFYNRITRTDPAPGEPLGMGEEMTFYMTKQNASWKRPDGGGDSSGGHVTFRACAHVGIFGACLT